MGNMALGALAEACRPTTNSFTTKESRIKVIWRVFHNLHYHLSRSS